MILTARWIVAACVCVCVRVCAYVCVRACVCVCVVVAAGCGVSVQKIACRPDEPGNNAGHDQKKKKKSYVSVFLGISSARFKRPAMDRVGGIIMLVAFVAGVSVITSDFYADFLQFTL
jgi:hypothetical protein